MKASLAERLPLATPSSPVRCCFLAPRPPASRTQGTRPRGLPAYSACACSVSPKVIINLQPRRSTVRLRRPSTRRSALIILAPAAARRVTASGGPSRSSLGGIPTRQREQFRRCVPACPFATGSATTASRDTGKFVPHSLRNLTFCVWHRRHSRHHPATLLRGPLLGGTGMPFPETLRHCRTHRRVSP